MTRLSKNADHDVSATAVQGAVILLDALGASTYSTQECANYLARRKTILRIVSQNYRSIYWHPASDMDGVVRIRKTEDDLHFKIFTFGDTMLLFSTGLTIGINLFQILGRMACDLINQALIQGILLRGAISVGEIIYDDENTAIGPAVAEAAMWHDQLQMVGVVYSPTASKVIDQVHSNIELWCGRDNLMDKLFCQEAVPTKSNGKQTLWLARWPYLLEKSLLELSHSRSFSNAQELVENTLRECGTYSADKPKAINTQSYLDRHILLDIH